MKKILIVLSLLAAFSACDKEEDATPAISPTNNNSNNNGNNGNNNNTLDNSYQFSDDNVECFPHSSDPSINANGILSLVSKPCSKSGSKLDGYFKWQSRPAPGTYTVVGSIGTVPFSPNLNTDEFSMVFYGHGQATLYSIGGTVEITKNASDTAKLDLNWTDVDMAYGNDSTVIQFSGNLKGL
jgi:hypothetical protein